MNARAKQVLSPILAAAILLTAASASPRPAAAESLARPAATSVVSTIAAPAVGQLPQRAHADAIAAARGVLQQERSELGIPAISAAVAIDGIIVWSAGIGYADLENRVPATAGTLYRTGSVSKPLTAAAVVQLATTGKLDLDAPIQRYVPSFPEKRYPITTRLLAGHIAGIRHYQGMESLTAGQRHYDDVIEALEIFADDPLLFAPGERYSYSSFAWNLISAVVQRAAGREFLSYMQDNVFDPLGMTHTFADDPRVVIPNRAGFYSFYEGRVINAPFVDNSYKWAGGGFISSVEDLVRLGSAHLGDDFLSNQARELLFTSQRTTDGQETGYGIGWRVERLGDLFADESTEASDAFADHQVMHHGGSSVGGRAFLLLVPEAELVVAVLVNFGRLRSGLTAARIAHAFLEGL